MKSRPYAEPVSQGALRTEAPHNRAVTPPRPTVDATDRGVGAPARRRYLTPPIEEALCDFDFDVPQPLDIAAIGQLAGQFKPSYSGTVRQRQLVQAGLTVTAPGAVQQTFNVAPGAARIEFPDTDPPKHVVSLGAQALSVHALRPYLGWDEDFRAHVETALEHYIRAAEPRALTRIGLRYINRIVVPAENLDLSRYFRRTPESPASAGSVLTSFLVRTEGVFDPAEEAVGWTTTFASTPGDADDVAFILDIALNDRRVLDAADHQTIAQRIEGLRDLERTIFESWITDDLREMFDGS